MVPGTPIPIPLNITVQQDPTRPTFTDITVTAEGFTGPVAGAPNFGFGGTEFFVETDPSTQAHAPATITVTRKSE